MRYQDWEQKQEAVHAETEHHEFDVAYVEEGTGDTVTLFLHGIPTWGFLFRDVYKAADHAIVPDLAGWGYTEHVGPGGYDRSIAVQTDLVRSFIEELGFESVQVVGHDTGGSVALRLAVYEDVVDRLVLSNIGSYNSWPVEFVIEMGTPEGAGGIDWTFEKVEQRIEKMANLGTSDGRDTEEFVTGLKGPFVDGPRAANAISRHASAYNVNHTEELTPHLEDVEVPTLLLWGADDVFQPPKWADKLADDLPNTEKEYLTARHWLTQDEPVAYRTALEDFL